MLYLHWLSFCSRNTPSLVVCCLPHGFCTSNWNILPLGPCMDISLHGYIPCVIQISGKNFFSTITQLKVVTQSFYQTVLFLYSMQSPNYPLKLSPLHICLFSIFLWVTRRAGTLPTWSLLYLRMFIGNQICCKIEWMINEWMTSQGDEHKKLWWWCGVAHVVKERKSTKFYEIPEKGTTNSDKDFQGKFLELGPQRQWKFINPKKVRQKGTFSVFFPAVLANRLYIEFWKSSRHERTFLCTRCHLCGV